jgi:hypothetical protein
MIGWGYELAHHALGCVRLPFAECKLTAGCLDRKLREFIVPTIQSLIVM